MTAKFRTPNRLWVSGAILVAIGFALAAGPGAAQAPKPTLPQDPAPPPPTEAHVYRLKHAFATEVGEGINRLFGGRASPVRVVADTSSNSVVVSAPKSDMAQILEVIGKLDVARPEPAAERTNIIQLRSIEPDKAFEETLMLLTGQRNFAVDRVRKLVILHGGDKQAEVVQALIRRLEETARAPVTQDVQVRVVWLVSGPLPEDAGIPTPPDDLKEILPSLAKLGIDKPRLAAQTLVRVTPNVDFQTKGAGPPLVTGTHCQFTVSGRYIDKKEAPSLGITIGAAQHRQQGSEEICKLKTEITAPPGHLIVLGATPSGTLTSVFVVQVLRKDAK